MSTVAALQMASGPNVQANLLEAERLVADAARKGACLAVLPENFALMGHKEEDKLAIAEQPGTGPIQAFLEQTARRYGLWLVGGTLPMACEDPKRVMSACLVYDDQGTQRLRYDKLHLFDVQIPGRGDGAGEAYAESETVRPGQRVAVTDTPCGRMGVAVCYDLRFPELFRSMQTEGVDLVAVPSAFTAATGRAHWDLLVRARAVENLAYVIAAAQGGYHINGRSTWGHSMVVDPWGTVLSTLPQGSGVVTATVDRTQQERTRKHFPALKHRRLTCELAPRPAAHGLFGRPKRVSATSSST